MKANLLDIEALLSQVAAFLESSDIAEAKTLLDEARDQLLSLAQGIESN